MRRRLRRMRAEVAAPAAKPQRKPWRRPMRRGRAIQGEGLEASQPRSWGAVSRLPRSNRVPKARVSSHGRASGEGASGGADWGISLKNGKSGEMESGKSRVGGAANS